MSGLVVLRRFKRSKEERESSAARRDADKGEGSGERTNGTSSKARNQAFNKDGTQEELAKRLKEW
jgi:hypothetical protein